MAHRTTSGPRKAVGKRTRFEVFKRDGFACQYCGKQPPQVTLEIDHIVPVAKGGTNDEMNLVTSCTACNSGKSDVGLGERGPRPDASLATLEMLQETAELRSYQSAKAERDVARSEVLGDLIEHWTRCLPPDSAYDAPPSDSTFLAWIATFGPEETETAIALAGASGNCPFDADRRVRYVAGILWNRARAGGEGSE
jgi:hypothetical protein